MPFPHRERLRELLRQNAALARRMMAEFPENAPYLQHHAECVERQLRHLSSLTDDLVSRRLPTQRELDEMLQ